MKLTILFFSFLFAVPTYGQLNQDTKQSQRQIHSNALQVTSKFQPVNSGELVDIIVEFVEAPMFIRRINRSAAALSLRDYEARFQEFAAALNINRNLTKKINANLPAVNEEYFKVFFGTRVSIPRSKIADISALPYVKGVHYNQEVKATLEKSIPQIGVDKVWQSFGTEGEGIRVGIIDSGIDYLHPALGGGYGPTFKVAGGYDFVNDDPDPMDDYGHGTHVAAIVSAHSPALKGVAPKSTLYAYKVLDVNGRGSSNDIISAIERSVDPNQDNDFSDKLDVVNLSLGSQSGYPTDPSSVAVNNASQLGVVFVIAAGNAGYSSPPQGKENNYFFNGSASIGSPGTAELAITVGAVDSMDQLAWFSSKGPNRVTFGIKPEIVAPGMQIHSAYLNNTTKKMDGTSMATPMVAGVVALIRSIHPEWSTAQVKSVLVNTARDIGLSAYKQGGGRVDAFRAISTGTWLSPSVLNLGLDNPSSSSWTNADTLIVHNTRNTPQQYAVSYGTVQNGISISAVPSNFTVPSGGMQPVIVTTTVNNAVIAVVPEDILLFSGRVAFRGSVDTLSFPWAFARGSRLTFTFNEEKPFLIATSPEGSFYGSGPDVYWTSPTTMEMYGYKPGTYDLFTLFPSSEKMKIVIKEGVILDDDDQVAVINSTEASVPLVYASKDHNGTPLSSASVTTKVLVNTLPNWGNQPVVSKQSSDTILVSPASARFSFRPIEFQFDAVQSKTFHIAQYPWFVGMSNAKVFTNPAENYVHQNFTFHYPPDVQQSLLVGEFFFFHEVNGTGNLYGAGFDIDTAAVSGNKIQMAGYFGKSDGSTYDVAMKFYGANDLQTGFIDFETLPIMTDGDSIVPITRSNVTPLTPKYPSGSTMVFGSAPIHLLTLWYNNSFGDASFHFRTIFRGANREERTSDVNHGTYEIYNTNGDLVFSNPLNDFPRSPRQLLPERYTVVMKSSNYWLRNKKGKIEQTAGFHLGSAEYIPPSMTSFLILNEKGLPTDALKQHEAGAVLFSAKIIGLNSENNVIPDSTKVWFRFHGSSEWTALPVTSVSDGSGPEGFAMRADISAAVAVDSVAVDLRMAVKDAAGNYNDYKIEPAFAVGNWISGDPSDVEDSPDELTPNDFIVYQNFPNPFNPSTTIRFGIPALSEVRLEIFNILGQRVDIIDKGVLGAGFHAVEWKAQVPSGVYFYRLVMNSSDGQSRSISRARKMILMR